MGSTFRGAYCVARTRLRGPCCLRDRNTPGLAFPATIFCVPVYHFTLHAYRSWRPDHPRGYTKRGEGYQPPSEEIADQYDRNAKQDAVTFRREIQQEILDLARSICEEEGWRLEAAGFDEGHTHLVVSSIAGKTSIDV